MKQIFAFFYLLLCIVSISNAQNSQDVFYEKGSNNMIRFYYDIDYYLVDKNCEFKYIERVANFDIPSNTFHGVFKDFDPTGRTILSGNYEKGNKEGEFTAYYPDGTLKWQTLFVNNKPQGKIIYNYPDGKPMLEIINDQNNSYINQYWDKFGSQKVKDGEGIINVTFPIIGFTEHGYSKYNISGIVTKGKQNGKWYTSFVNENKKRSLIPLKLSIYENGILIDSEIDPMFEDMLIDINSLSYTPNEPFANAELLQSKNCTFDEHTGFNSYISKKFSAFLNDNKITEFLELPLTITYLARVTKNGEAYTSTITKSSRELPTKEMITLKKMINQISYYLPSYLDNKPITDKLIITFQIQNDGTTYHVPPVQIVRENGF